MGSAPSRGSFESRLGSSARRGAYVAAGVPGVYRVTRSRTATATTPPQSHGRASVWITPAPVEISGEMLNFRLRAGGDLVAKADFADSTAQAWAGQDAAVGGNPYSMALQAFSSFADAQALLDEGFMGLYRSSVESDAGTAYTYPGGSELHPDDVATVLSLKVVGDVNLIFGAAGGTTSIRQVDPANYDVDDGPIWQTPALISGADVVMSMTTPASPESFEFDVVYDEPSGVAMYVVSLDDFALSGDAWGWDTSDWEYVLLEAVGGAGDGSAPRWVATVQPARYRLTISADEWVPDLSGNFYWDAGLYLPSDFASLAGYPTTLPPGAAELDFFVLGPGVDYTDTWPDFYMAYVYSGGNGTDDSGITSPIAGSHLWVYYDVGGGTPADPPNPPSTYVPASLAENGTA